MRVLAHIHTFNDADVIDQTIEALLRQTRPIDGILIVDNASIDGTLEQPSVKHATVLCHRARYYPCHFNFWSGCLYRLSAVSRIGLPNRDYMLDWGETEYGYRLMKAGYKGFMHQDAILQHNIRGYRSLTPTEVEGEADEAPAFGYPPSGLAYPPIRCYYSCRNIVYFALYEFREGGIRALCRIASRALRLTLYFLRKPRNHSKQRAACFRGLWHGLTGNITARY